jgi:hypothetical protein
VSSVQERVVITGFGIVLELPRGRKEAVAGGHKVGRLLFLIPSR